VLGLIVSAFSSTNIVFYDGQRLIVEPDGTNQPVKDFMSTNDFTCTNKIIMWYLNATNYSYITFVSNQFYLTGISNGVTYTTTNTVY
jgi:hypothetical protein